MSTGHILWQDLTVPDAAPLRDFYSKVVGWTSEDVDMGGYADYSMNDAEGNTVAGVCHARGTNSQVPPQWLIYIEVASVAEATERALAEGGKVVDGPRAMGEGQFAVIQDPAGAVFAIIETPEE